MSDDITCPLPGATIPIGHFYKRIPFLFSFVKGVKIFFKSLTGKPISKQLEENKKISSTY